MRNNLLPLLAERCLNEPLLMSATKASVIVDVLGGRIGVGSIDGPEPDANAFSAKERRRGNNGASFAAADGVAIIRVHGSLVNRGAWVGASSGLTSYEGLAAQIDAAEADADIKAHLLDMNSHGGEAAGMLEFAAKVAATTKPIIAHVNAVAASAAYGIASAADEIVMGSSASLGSIGVLIVHLDHSGEMEQKGRAATIIHAGAKKVDGNPFGPLSDRVKADLQTRVDAIYGDFTALVEAGRGDNLTAEMARSTEAGMFTGQAAIEAGLADRIATFDEVLTELQSKARMGATTRKETFKMGDKTSAETAENPITAADLDAAKAKAHGEGAAEANARTKAILTCDEAKGREAQAQTMALETSLSADEAKALLAKSPKASTKVETNVDSIEDRADGLPELGATEPPKTGAKTPMTDMAKSMNKEAS